MTVGVTGTNLAVLAVDETLGMLIPGNLPCDAAASFWVLVRAVALELPAPLTCQPPLGWEVTC